MMADKWIIKVHFGIFEICRQMLCFDVFAYNAAAIGTLQRRRAGQAFDLTSRCADCTLAVALIEHAEPSTGMRRLMTTSSVYGKTHEIKPIQFGTGEATLEHMALPSACFAKLYG